MFGLTFEKLLLIAVIAVFLLGPQRLPEYAAKLAVLVKRLRAFADTAQDRVKEELGEEGAELLDWKSLDPRQYDPRRIIREALTETPAVTVAPPAPSPPPDVPDAGSSELSTQSLDDPPPDP